MYTALRKGQTNPWGQNFGVNRKDIILTICCKFWSLILYIFFNVFMYVYSPRPGADNPLVTESPEHFDHLLQVSKWSLWILILYTFFNYFIHIYSPGTRADKPLGSKFWCQKKALTTSTICCRFQKNLFEFWFYTHILIFFPHFPHAYRQGQTTLCGQNSDVNRKALSLCPFVASFINISLKCDFIHTFACFIHVYSPGAGADNPLGSEFLYKHIPHVTLVICCKFLLLNYFLTVFPI